VKPSRVSVVIPVYNRAELVAQAIGSVQRQEGVEVDILVADDGSTDETAAAVAALAMSDNRIQLIRGHNGGPAAARNRAVAVARADYLAFLDSDDLIPPGRLRRQIGKLERRPDVVAVIGTVLGFEALNSDGEPEPHPAHRPFYNLALHCATFRREYFLELGPLDESLIFGEDIDLFLRLFETDARMILEAEIGSYYRHHAGNMVHHTTARQHGYAKAYARSLRRRRAAGHIRPVRSFFRHPVQGDVDFCGREATA